MAYKTNFSIFFLLIFPLIFLSGKCNRHVKTKAVFVAQKEFVSSDTINGAVIIRNPGNNADFKNRLFEQVPSIAAIADGSCIFAAWYSGGNNEGPGNYITVAVSLDKGRSWQNNQLIIYPEKPTTRFFDPALWRDQSGLVHLYYASSENPENLKKYELYDFRAGVYELDIFWDNTMIEYKDPRRLSNGIMMNSPVYIKEINSALFPISLWKPWTENYTNDPNYIGDGTFAYIRKYEGDKSDTSISLLAEIEVDPDSIRKCDEHMIAQVTTEGDLLCLIRTKADSAVYYSRSGDFGKTWSKAEPYTAVWPTTSSRFHLAKLKSGRLLLIMNDSKKRTNMTAFLSEDGGYTWPYKLLLDDREKVSYPDADQTDDGTIHIVFDRDRFGAKDILYCRITEADILHEETANIFKTRINIPNK